MLLNRSQVLDRLKISESVYRSLMESGAITPINPRNPAKKRYYPKFESKDIDEFLKAVRKGAKVIPPSPSRRRLPDVPQPPIPPITGAGIITRLERIEQKIDNLYALWS